MGSRRYIRNSEALSELESASLAAKKVAVIGCGGLGGYVIEMLVRIGVGCFVVVDPDTFEESNLNRQLLCTEAVIGQSKVEAARARMVAINSQVEVEAVCDYLTDANAADLIKGCDCVVDALDSVSARRALADACASAGIPLVYGAIAGWYGQVCVLFPGSAVYDILFNTPRDKGAELELGNLSFTAACVASFQAAEAVKVLLGRSNILRDKLLMVDLQTAACEVVDL